jgi:hypothetical protein
MIFKRNYSYYRKHWLKYARRFLLLLFPRNKPNFLIIGAQKAATTSLYNYLHQLPEFCGAINKEVNYFNHEINYGKDLAWYHSFFRSFSLSKNTLFFEATPEYIYYPSIPEKIFRYNPDLKLVVVLREPIARAYSAWKMYEGFFRRKEFYRVAQGIHPNEENLINTYFFKGRSSFPSFEECVEIELEQISKSASTWEPSLLRRGLYAAQLKRYLQYFKPEQLLVIGFKDLTEHPDEELRKIYLFITGKQQPASSASLLKRNSIEREICISESARKKLNEFYANPNVELESLLGKKINW